MAGVFVIGRNPEEDSTLPYLLRLPIEEGLVLKARDTWPRSARIYCHPCEADWPQDAEVIEETPVSSCRRRGPVIDLVLDRARLSRSQFVFTETRGRPAIFWQTQKAARAANPGARILWGKETRSATPTWLFASRPTRHQTAQMLWSIRYRLLCWLLRLLVRCGLDELDLETAVLRHQLKVLRRGGGESFSPRRIGRSSRRRLGSCPGTGGRASWSARTRWRDGTGTF